MALPPGFTGIRVLGLEQAKQNLKTLSDKLQNKIVRQACNVAIGIVAKKVKATTYGAGRHRITGLLERSQGLSSRIKRDEVSARLRVRDVNLAKNTKVASAVKSFRSFANGKTPSKYRAFYWWFLEHGTATRTTKKSKANRGAVGASPWVVPAFDSTVDQALDAFQKKLADRLAEECQQLPKGV